MIAFIFQPYKNGEKSRLWSARIRLEGWPKPRYFPLHVTDKRVADQKMRAILTDLEREAHGVGVPRAAREAQHTSLSAHHAAFIAACESAQLSKNTLGKYRHSLPKLFARCGWQTLRDVSASVIHRLARAQRTAAEDGERLARFDADDVILDEADSPHFHRSAE